MVPVVVDDGPVGDAMLEVQLPYTSSFSLSPLIYLFTNCLNFCGMEWVEKLKNLTITSQTLVESTPISDALLGEPSLVLAPVLSEEEVISLLAPTESSDSGYFLQSCTKGTPRGLGKSSPPIIRGRGRRSYIAKAYSKARKDVMEGKQQSIERELRAVHAQKKGRRQNLCL